jgi:hypothetical protein
MTKRVVLPIDHYIARPPVLSSAVLYMALDLYYAPGWLWGAAWTVMGLLWLAWVMLRLQQETKPLPGYGEQKDKP